jgi:hypothetical protein
MNSEEPTENIEEPSATKKSATKVTSTVKKTKPKKDSGRVEAGKSLRKNTQISDDQPINQSVKNEKSSFSLTQVISAVSIVVSLAGLYYKREELMSLVKPKRQQTERNEVREVSSKSEAEDQTSAGSEDRTS